MIPIVDEELYNRSLELISEYVGNHYRGRIAQIYLAARYLDKTLPVVGGAAGVAVNELQSMLDDFYRKHHRTDLEGSVAAIFQNNHLSPTGVTGIGQTGPSNIWRNNVGLQKANICFASEAELSLDAFLGQPRIECPHLIKGPNGTLAGAKCNLNLSPTYRGEDGVKSLRRDPLTNLISIVDTRKTDHWAKVVSPGGRRLPVVPLIVVLYFASDLAGGRAAIDVMDFIREFGFSAEEYHLYFDDDPALDVHAKILVENAELSWTRADPAFGVAPLVLPSAHIGPLDPDLLPVLVPKQAPPAGSHWWSAEQAVETYLNANGWNVINRAAQAVGFDLEIWRNGDSQRRYVEVKSSVGKCAPVLTNNEYEAAQKYGSRYYIAVVENYDPDEDLTILWVRNPAALPIVGREVRQYPVPRGTWLPRADTGLS